MSLVPRTRFQWMFFKKILQTTQLLRQHGSSESRSVVEVDPPPDDVMTN